jgi:8-oxoguanine deaminase
MAADLAAFRLDTIDMSGQWDPVATLVLCGPHKASCTIANGRIIVRNGRLVSLELAPVLARHAELARALANGEN